MNRESEVALAAIRAVEERDAETLFGLRHDDVEFHEAPTLTYAGSSRGKDFLAGSPRRNRSGPGWAAGTAPADRARAPNGPTGHRHRQRTVVVVYRQRAVAASGEGLDAPVLGLYHVRDSKLARAQMFHLDTAAIMRFLAEARESERQGQEIPRA